MTDRARIAAWISLSACFGLSACLGLSACAPEPEPRATGSAPALSGIRFLAEGADSPGFARAIAPRDYFVFPADHAPHPEFRTEWWYFTGNVFDRDRNHYGFELTIFRIGANAAPQLRESELATSSVWMAHVAVTDTARREFQVAERLSRGVPGIAGLASPDRSGNEPVVIQVEDFSIAFDGDIVTLNAREPGFGIELELGGLARIVPQGDNGLDPKGPEPGNASYYFSAPRLSVTGQITSGDTDAVPVEGAAWMDREWGTSALSSDLAGWDWFSLQLTDGRDVMYYRLRTSEGGTSPFSGGSIVDSEGNRTALAAADVSLAVLDYWRSDATGASYPVRWSMSIPGFGLSFAIRPVLPQQELDLAVRYWEGAIVVTGTNDSEGLGGRGYLELTGY